jgi:hypothetical protein
MGGEGSKEAREGRPGEASHTQTALTPLVGSGCHLWEEDSTRAVTELRDEWTRSGPDSFLSQCSG